jgi:hypothetical protein
MTIILNKTPINDIEKELTACVINYDYLCLSRTQKWYIFEYNGFFLVDLRLMTWVKRSQIDLDSSYSRSKLFAVKLLPNTK